LRYKRRPNFSKHATFKRIIRRRRAFLKTQGAFYRRQSFQRYPLRFPYLNDYRWSTAVKNVHFSPNMSKYGAYLERLNALSRRYREKVRIFDFKVFKAKLGQGFDLSKHLFSRDLYFYRFLVKSFSKRNKIRKALLGLKYFKRLDH